MSSNRHLRALDKAAMWHRKEGQKRNPLDLTRMHYGFAAAIEKASKTLRGEAKEADRLYTLLAICYQIAGSILLCPTLGGDTNDKEIELLLNTLSRPDGSGAEILLKHKGPFQEVTTAALEAEK